jgi:Arc/MetJ-type ribon-helix-helix transcriptional regulator
MTERTTVRLPEALVRRVKRKARAEGVSMTALIERGLRNVLSERDMPRTAKRVLPPVSSARGGLMPEIDLNDTAALEEADDLARFLP